MGLDVINEDAIRTQIVEPLITQLTTNLTNAIIPALRDALDESLDRALSELGNVLRGGTDSVQAIADKLIHDVDGLIAKQAGWEVEIVIQPIKIRLGKPK